MLRIYFMEGYIWIVVYSPKIVAC